MRTNTSTPKLTARACAKINLTLDVLGGRADGYHEIRSLLLGVDLFDRIRCRLTHEPGIQLVCTDPDLQGRNNLVWRAVEAIAKHTGLEPRLAIEVEKHVPVAAGLGGGSSDAAATLRLCNHLWDAGLSDEELAHIGAEIGSDVPAFFYLPAAFASGRGEVVEPVSMAWSGWVLLVFVGTRVSTADVYRTWRPSDASDLPKEAKCAIIAAKSAGVIMEHVSNHLTPAVLRVAPMVANVLNDLRRAGFGHMQISGAGSTMYELYDDQEEACRAARRIDERNMGVRTRVVAAPMATSDIISEVC